MPEVIFDSAEVGHALDKMATAMQSPTVCMLGIQRGGAHVADALQKRLEAMDCELLRGDLDISFYRDDLDTIGPNPEVRTSHIPFDMTNQNIWLIDDVLFTGRTIRAALGEIFDFGRPSSVNLAVLVDRGGRELPIQPHVVGLQYHAEAVSSVKVNYAETAWHIERRKVKT